jgi:putative phosphoesterase
MRIGVLSDTHGDALATLAAARLLEELDVAELLHCGDIGTAEIPGLLSAWPAHYVFGNCDGNEAELRAAIVAAGHQCHEREGALELAGRKIAWLHSDDRWRFLELARCNQFDLVCYGHTHVALQEHVGRTLVLNPGALQRARPRSFAVVDLATMKVTSVPID